LSNFDLVCVTLTASVSHDIVLALFVCFVCFVVSLHARRATAATRLAHSILKEDMGKRHVLCSALVALYLMHLQTVNAQQQWTIQRNSMDCIFPQIGANAEKLWPTSSYLPRGNTIRRMTGGAGLKVNGGEELSTAGPLLLLFRHSPPHPQPQAISTAGFSIEYYGTYKVRSAHLGVSSAAGGHVAAAAGWSGAAAAVTAATAASILHKLTEDFPICRSSKIGWWARNTFCIIAAQHPQMCLASPRCFRGP
jgi:hypothetical protein